MSLDTRVDTRYGPSLSTGIRFERRIVTCSLDLWTNELRTDGNHLPTRLPETEVCRRRSQVQFSAANAFLGRVGSLLPANGNHLPARLQRPNQDEDDDGRHIPDILGRAGQQLDENSRRGHPDGQLITRNDEQQARTCPFHIFEKNQQKFLLK